MYVKQKHYFPNFFAFLLPFFFSPSNLCAPSIITVLGVPHFGLCHMTRTQCCAGRRNYSEGPDGGGDWGGVCGICDEGRRGESFGKK